ncbi:MAG: hypothetical protein GY757_31335 [bacterium]|nr:hypothetical protein [bacterium]
MNKTYLIPILLVSITVLFLTAGNQELFEQPPRVHTVDDNGEVILKLKKADWIYDCNDCHKDFKVRTNARHLVSEHQQLRYDHIKGEKWCFFCHFEEPAKRNRIHLPEKNEIYRGPQDMIKLCSQCHGKKLQEWKTGLHGKVTGSWLTYGDVKTERKTCEQCHSPHHPRSLPVKPFPGPGDGDYKKSTETGAADNNKTKGNGS